MATRSLVPARTARRILVWLAVTGLWAAGTLYLAARADRPPDVRETAPAQGRPWAGEGAVPPRSAGEPRHSAVPQEVVGALPEARQVAAAFAAAYATWRYDEAPGDVAARLEPHVAPGLAARLRAPASGATAGREMIRERGAFATAAVQAVQTQHLSPGHIDLLVLVEQEIHSAAGVDERSPAYAVRMAPVDGRWLVEDFTP